VHIDQSLSYRRALGAFPTGVTVVTADGEDGPLGVTVSSFTSVSLTPPLILWCLDVRAWRRRGFADVEHFTVNVLKAGEHARAQRFSSGECNLRHDDLERGVTGAPRLKDVLACLECETRQRILLGDHLAIVGEVTAFDVGEGSALLHFRGRFGEAAEPERPDRGARISKLPRRPRGASRPVRAAE
jgi:flavin reductase (DIM6/NTAB) family NADH-FMN oxidoreductase RutF